MRFLRFRQMLDEFAGSNAKLRMVAFEEVRRHVGTDAAHIYGGLMGTLTAWCEYNLIPYSGIPIGTWKKALGLKGNCGKPEVMLKIGDLGYNPSTNDEADAIGVLLHVIGKPI
jgi:crossover junction endodeoxyribonuclease RuvC